MSGEQRTVPAVRVDAAALLGALGFLTLTVLALTERFAEVPPVLAAYAGALALLGRDEDPLRGPEGATAADAMP